jgi:hypothetical protein
MALSKRKIFATALATAIISPANAARLTPSTRADGSAAAGAQTLSVSIPAGAIAARVAFCFYQGSGLDFSAISLDGQTATQADKILNTGADMSSLWQVSGFGTGTKTLAYTVPSGGTSFTAIAIEYHDTALTAGAHGNGFSTGDPSGTASTASLANSNGDLILTSYCASHANGTVPTLGSGQSKLDETTNGGLNVYYGFTTETATGAGDVQSVTGTTPGIASTVVTVVPNTIPRPLTGPLGGPSQGPL